MILSQVLVVTKYVSVMFSLDKMNLYTDYEGPDEGMFLAVLNKIKKFLTFSF